MGPYISKDKRPVLSLPDDVFSGPCKQCELFEWADGKFPLCKHKRRSILRTCFKTGQNNGRRFFCCSMPKAERCFFGGVDRGGTTARRGAAAAHVMQRTTGSSSRVSGSSTMSLDRIFAALGLSRSCARQTSVVVSLLFLTSTRLFIGAGVWGPGRRGW